MVKSQGVIRTNRDKKSTKPTPFSVIKIMKDEDRVNKIIATKIEVINDKYFILLFRIY